MKMTLNKLITVVLLVTTIASIASPQSSTLQTPKLKVPANPVSSTKFDCDDEAAVLTPDGSVQFPADADLSDPPVYEDVDEKTGMVDDLYPSLEDGTDTWYSNLPCEVSIGGNEPSQSEINSALGTVPANLDSLLQQWSSHINLNQLPLKPPSRLASASALAAPYVKPQQPFSPKKERMVLGGRDLVFVHGLKLNHLIDEMNLVQGAQKRWVGVSDPTKPGYINNPEFYKHNGYTGYYYYEALSTWQAHISKFLQSKGIQNRYLIVAYPNNQRLEIGVQAILKQIADAMQFGTGVIDPSGIYGTAKFGTPSYVMVTHSTGGLASNVALTAAKAHPNLGVGFVADHCKARIASQSAFGGSNYATVTVASAYFLPAAGLAGLVGDVKQAFGLPNNILPNIVKRSVLVDLVPLISQTRWGPYSMAFPAPTVTLAAGHPSFTGTSTSLTAPLKWLLHRGLDDGVVTINSQVGNPKAFIFNPSGYRPKLPRLKVFDMGLWKKGQGLRSLGYFIDQVIDPSFNPTRLGVVAGSATPYVSPSGMLQPVQNPLNPGSPETLMRYPNHYSFLLSTADHYTGTHDKQGQLTAEFNSGNYLSSDGQVNNEETRVITDSRIYNLFTPLSGYPNDNQPLLRTNNIPPLIEIVRGRRVKFKIKIGPIKKEKTWWIWKRIYHLLDGYEGNAQFDYAYRSVLKN